jgi:protease I
MSLEGAHVAIFVDYQFEDMELMWPKMRLEEAGATVHVLSTAPAGKLTYTGKYGYPVTSTHCVKDSMGFDYDVLVFPGGFSPDYLRRDKDILQMIKTHHSKGKVGNENRRKTV